MSNEFRDIFDDEIDGIAERTVLIAIREELRRIREIQERSQEKIDLLLESDSRGVQMARSTAEIANEVTRLVDGFCTQNAALTETIEGLKGYLTSDAVLLRMSQRGEALNDALDV